MLKKICLVAFALCFLSFSASAKGKVLKFNNSIAEDATFAVMEGLKGAVSQISFEKGTYHFWPEKAMEKFCYISNHNDALTRIAFFLENQNSLTIDGNGSKFIFHGCIIPFWIENSTDVTVKNLTIDFAEAFHSEMVVVDTHQDGNKKSIDFSISEDYPYEIRNGELIFVKSYYSHNIGQTIYYDPATKGPSFNWQSYGFTNFGKATTSRYLDKLPPYKYKSDRNDVGIRGRGMANGSTAVELRPGVVRLNNQRKALPPKGMVLTTKGGQGENRFAPAFKNNNVTNFKAENVTVHHAGGMAFLFENCDNVDIYKCRVVPSGNRVVSVTADATHFVGCRGAVSLRESVFQSQLDDAMNVHGAYQEVMDIIDSNSVGVRVGHYQQLGFCLAKSGDKVGLVRLKESFHSYTSLTVDRVEFINGRYQRIYFKEKLPSKLTTGDLLENLSAYPKILVEGCDISSNRARGILISTPSGTIIRNNYFSTDMSALLLPVESGSWFESGNATDVLIENNTFKDCSKGNGNSGVIRFHTDDDSPNVAFQNIKILNNKFEQYNNFILEASNIKGLLFKGNKITNSGSYPSDNPSHAAITIQYCSDVRFEKNTYKGNAPKMIELLKGQAEVKFE